MEVGGCLYWTVQDKTERGLDLCRNSIALQVFSVPELPAALEIENEPARAIPG
jgi:hypothetical protein